MPGTISGQVQDGGQSSVVSASEFKSKYPGFDSLVVQGEGQFYLSSTPPSLRVNSCADMFPYGQQSLKNQKKLPSSADLNFGDSRLLKVVWNTWHKTVQFNGMIVSMSVSTFTKYQFSWSTYAKGLPKRTHCIRKGQKTKWYLCDISGCLPSRTVGLYLEGLWHNVMMN